MTEADEIQLDEHKLRCHDILVELVQNADICGLVVAYRMEEDPDNEMSIINYSSVKDIALVRLALSEIIDTVNEADTESSH